MLNHSEKSRGVKICSPKMNSLDVLISSPQYCFYKCMGTRNENLYFDTGNYRVNDTICESGENFKNDYVKTRWK